MMLTGPVDVTEKVLRRAGMTVDDIDLYRDQRGLRLGGAALPAGLRHRPRQGQRQRRRDRHGPPARRHRRDDPRHRARRARAHAASRPRSSRSASAPAWARRRSSSGSRPRHAEDRHRRGRRVGSGPAYPPPFREAVKGPLLQALGDAAGLTQFGVNLVRLKPGRRRPRSGTGTRARTSSSSCSKASSCSIEDEGETILRAGDAAGFKAGVPNGHHLLNRTERDGVFLVVGSRAPAERAHYPDLDLLYEATERPGPLHQQGRRAFRLKRRRVRRPRWTSRNFRFETDADGIATATWDRPGRSMNVITLEVIDELSRIVETVASDAAIKGCVVTSGKEAFSGGADLTMLQGLGALLREAQAREGRRGGDARLLRGIAQAVAALPAARDLRQAFRGGDPRRLPRRRLRARARLPSPGRVRRRRRPASACPRSRSGSSPAPAARSAWRG